MQSTAKDVNHYLAEVPENRREVLSRLRKLCLDTLKGYEESMAYGMPSYKKKGTVEIAFASQKNYISFYVLKQEVINKHRALLEGLNVGKGCIRYSSPKKLDLKLAEQLLRATNESESDIC